MFTLEYADGYYIEYDGEPILSFDFELMQNKELGQWIVDALNAKEESKEFTPFEELMNLEDEEDE